MNRPPATPTTRAPRSNALPTTERGMNPGDQAPPGTPGTGEAPCGRCAGTGRLDAGPCPDCGGTGTVTEAIGGA